MVFLKNHRQPLSENQFLETGMAQFYDDHARSFMGPVYRRLADKAAGFGLTRNRVLDIGTGTGLLAVMLAKTKPEWRITGIDIAEEMLRTARQTVIKNEVAAQIDFLQAAAEALPFPDNTFDMVVSNASLHLWAQPQKVFNEIARVTAAEGFCLIWDNLRLARFNPVPGILSRLMRMTPKQRRLWYAAMRSAYTRQEAANLLKETSMKRARINIVSGLSMLEIEWRKPVL